MKMELTRCFVGQIEIPKGKNLVVSDPCYDAGEVYTKEISSKDIVPGKFNCYVLSDDSDTPFIIQLVHDDKDTEAKVAKNRSWRVISDSIGVDAGLAGFFIDKPDFADDVWMPLCDWMFGKDVTPPHNENDVEDAFIRTLDNGGVGFWSTSGCGDGVYSLHAIRTERKIVALEIRF